MNKETEITRKRYDRYSFFYNFLERPFELLLFRKWRRKILPPLRGRILEVGVGTGKNLQYYVNPVRITGIDLSKRMLRKAKGIANRFALKDNLLQMDAQKMSFKDNSFDTVLCTFVLCSVPDPIKALKEMKRVCKPKGKIVMIEHVLSKNILIKIYQHLHNPFTRFIFGFNVNRDTISNIQRSGLTILHEENLTSNDIFKYVICKLQRSKQGITRKNDHK
ncbi:class I SAM-dependent methyltransferase [Candidatus Woesearchaeota archaeon]|nr:class I SAM-dependent methyltransferase [Candidatus Woesearchaeota archaeon]